MKLLLLLPNIIMDYLINYSEIKNITISELIQKLISIDGIFVKDITFKNLTFSDDITPINTGCGVYIFKHKGKIYYVGKAASRSFIERIPAHFDIRTNAWFNSLLRTGSRKEEWTEDFLKKNRKKQ